MLRVAERQPDPWLDLLANTSHQRVRQCRALGGGPEHLSPEETGGRRRPAPWDFPRPRAQASWPAEMDGDARRPVRSGQVRPGRGGWAWGARGRLLTKGGGQLARAHGRVRGARSARQSGPPPERTSDPGTFARTIVARWRSVGMCRRRAVGGVRARAGVRSSGVSRARAAV